MTMTKANPPENHLHILCIYIADSHIDPLYVMLTLQDLNCSFLNHDKNRKYFFYDDYFSHYDVSLSSLIWHSVLLLHTYTLSRKHHYYDGGQFYSPQLP